jgi:hypothetical protein
MNPNSGHAFFIKGYCRCNTNSSQPKKLFASSITRLKKTSQTLECFLKEPEKTSRALDIFFQ